MFQLNWGPFRGLHDHGEQADTIIKELRFVSMLKLEPAKPLEENQTDIPLHVGALLEQDGDILVPIAIGETLT